MNKILYQISVMCASGTGAIALGCALWFCAELARAGFAPSMPDLSYNTPAMKHIGEAVRALTMGAAFGIACGIFAGIGEYFKDKITSKAKIN